MFFSVIIPVYNVENYLSECVGSILKQTFADYEIILVDDGSKDNSGAICDGYAVKNTKIRVIHKFNGGQADARNIGLQAAQGEYIVFIDSDDFLINDHFLQDAYENLSGADLLCCKYQKYIEESGILEDCTFSYTELPGCTKLDGQVYGMVKSDSYFGMAWAKVIRRKFLVENGILFDVNLVCEDMDWFYRVVIGTSSMKLVDRSYFAYRQRNGSVTKVIKLRNLTDFLITVERWKTTIEESPNLSEKMRNALLGSLSKYYANMLITYVRVLNPSKKLYKDRIRRMSYLLNYGISRRPQKICKIYRLIGLNGVLAMLKLADILRHWQRRVKEFCAFAPNTAARIRRQAS